MGALFSVWVPPVDGSVDCVQPCLPFSRFFSLAHEADAPKEKEKKKERKGRSGFGKKLGKRFKTKLEIWEAEGKATFGGTNVQEKDRISSLVETGSRPLLGHFSPVLPKLVVSRLAPLPLPAQPRPDSASASGKVRRRKDEEGWGGGRGSDQFPPPSLFRQRTTDMRKRIAAREEDGPSS